jgi:hypothetical protein
MRRKRSVAIPVLCFNMMLPVPRSPVRIGRGEERRGEAKIL